MSAVIDDDFHDLVIDIEAAEHACEEISALIAMGNLGRWEVPSKDCAFVSPKDESDRVVLGIESMQALFASANLERALQRVKSRRDTLAQELRTLIIQRVK